MLNRHPDTHTCYLLKIAQNKDQSELTPVTSTTPTVIWPWDLPFPIPMYIYKDFKACIYTLVYQKIIFIEKSFADQKAPNQAM